MEPQFREALREKLIAGMTEPLPALTRRRVVMHRLPGKAQAVIGMRRAGKTTFLHQVMADGLAAGSPRGHMVYLNFEDERLAGISTADLTWLLEEYYREQPGARGQHRVLWALDEIQLVPGWESFVRRVMDSEVVEIFLSGSSARLLSKEVATAMRGRALDVIIHPFSFWEALDHAGISPPAGRTVTTAGRSVMENAVSEYLVRGGFPEVQGLATAPRQALLQSYVDVALLRDVVERHHVANVTALRFVVRHLMANAGRPFSVPKIHGLLSTQGIAVAKNTLHELIGHLEDAFLVRSLWMEADSERQRMVNPRKSWPVDPALIPLFERSGKPNTGHALETAVLIELERRRAAVAWVRVPDGGEVDFLARFHDGSECLIQVCASAAAPDTARRELAALQSAAVRHPRARLLLVTLTGREITVPIPAGIETIPAWRWFLDDEMNAAG
jgi:predicted AAA+ superfamily ATPase